MTKKTDLAQEMQSDNPVIFYSINQKNDYRNVKSEH